MAVTRGVRTGVVVPIFQSTASKALDVAARAEAAGVDGVFCYDHVWPLGQPERPALAPFPVLATLAGTTDHVALGTLVARVGLVPDAVLLGQFAALDALAPGRAVAGIGTGDRLSAGENEAYGVEFTDPAARRASLMTCARQLLGAGVVVWIGDGAAATRRVAYETGAALNVWDAPPARVADEARRCEVTWAGPSPEGVLEPRVRELWEAGATWVVFAWPVDLDELAAAAGALGGRGAASEERRPL